MNTKLFNMNLVKYELRNLTGNIFTVIFGLIFPIFMVIFMAPIIVLKVPEELKITVMTSIFITTSMMIPLATVLIGYSAIFSQELENGIPLRLRLFGYSERSLLISKISANLIFMTISLILYTLASYMILDIQVPTVTSAIILTVSLYLFGGFLFILAYGIALYFKKFGPTYSVTMIFYFAVMMSSGMFGVQAKDFPKALKNIAYLFPATYIGGDFIDFWQGGSYNFAPYIQSFIFFGGICLVILFLAMHHDSRKVKLKA